MSFKDFKQLLKDHSPAPTSKAAEEKSSIVVVDDDASVLNALGTVLGQHYIVRLCDNAFSGLTAVDDEVCAVILDIKLKGNDGFWACDSIRSNYPNIPIIFYSAYQDIKDPFRVINEHRPFGYLVKDGDLRKLLSTVDQAVRLYRVILKNQKIQKAIASN